MKKRCILLIGFLVLFHSIAFAAKIEKTEDYKGTRIYSVTDTDSSSAFNFSNHYQLTTIFSSVYGKNDTIGLKKITLQYYTDQYDIIAIRPMIKINIDGQMWDVTSTASSTVTSDGIPQFTWLFPDDLVRALLATNKAVSFKFFCNTTEGEHFREYTVPYRIVATVQKMYLQTVEPENSVLVN